MATKYVYIDPENCNRRLAAVSEGLHPTRVNSAKAVVYNDETNGWGFIDTAGKVAIPVGFARKPLTLVSGLLISTYLLAYADF
jgi:hypothetical protein